MIDKVKRYIALNKMLTVNDKVVLGVSGGADSTALLEILYRLSKEYNLSLYVVHINHGIREEAGEDAQYVETLCRERNIPFYLFEEDIPLLATTYHLSEEEAGRKYRYECFAKIMRKVGAAKLAVAHHLDDQAETVLFHLVRGTDISGMAGMRPVSLLTVSDIAPKEKETGVVDGEGTHDFINSNAKIIRPLLDVRRCEIEKFLKDNNIAWQEDVTNKDDNYARNRIRNRVMAELSEVNEGAAVHIAEFAGLSAKYDEYIKKQALLYIEREVEFFGAKNDRYDISDVWQKEDFFPGGDRIRLKNGICRIRIKRNHLLKEDGVIISRVLYELLTMIAGAKKDVGREHVNVLCDMLEKQSGKEAALPYGVSAFLSYEWLIMEKINASPKAGIEQETLRCKVVMADIEADGTCEINIYGDESGGPTVILSVVNKEDDKKSIIDDEEILQKNYTKYFDCDTIGDTLYIRYPEQGDYLLCDNEGHSKKLSKLFKDMKIPKDERMCQPVLAAGKEILWVLGERRCEAHKVTVDTRRILKVEYII